MTASDDTVRRYLDQRREAGDRDIVFDTLTRTEALALVARGTAGPRTTRPAAEREVPRQAHAADRPNERSDAPAGEASSWRDTLREAGAAPPSQPHHTTMTRAPDGLIVGTATTELFAGAGALDSLAAVATSVASCTKCPLYATAKNPVPGEGNPAAELMLVGEAPGATEDETGRPFVGAAGQLLTKILQAIELEREQVFICNVLKHRPPGNRNPLPDEVRACSPYLIRQIELIHPKVIVALGTFAAQTLLDTKLTIGKLRGQIHRYYGVPLVVTYHPAALLRNPAWKRPTWEDVQLARSILDRGRTPDSGGA